jgi:hypothetical protein
MPPDELMPDELVTVAQIAEQFGVTPNTVRIWRFRHEDFPKPTKTLPGNYNMYNMSELWDWYILRWPERASRLMVYLHRFALDGSELVKTTTSSFGPAPEARGYLQAVRDFKYAETWHVWATGMGFVAERGPETHIWALDPTKEPDHWFVYEKRYKTAADRREK